MFLLLVMLLELLYLRNHVAVIRMHPIDLRDRALIDFLPALSLECLHFLDPLLELFHILRVVDGTFSLQGRPKFEGLAPLAGDELVRVATAGIPLRAT